MESDDKRAGSDKWGADTYDQREDEERREEERMREEGAYASRGHSGGYQSQRSNPLREKNQNQKLSADVFLGTRLQAQLLQCMYL